MLWLSCAYLPHFGDPSRVWWLQLSSWMIIVLISKVILAVILFAFESPVSDFGCWAMSPVADNPKLELVLVMVVGPYILNAAQFWVRNTACAVHMLVATTSHATAMTTQILDNFLKKNVTPSALREVRHAINRNRGGTEGSLNLSPGGRTREIRMTKVTRRDDEQLLLSATPPDVEQDAATLAAFDGAPGHPSGRDSGTLSLASAEFSPLPARAQRPRVGSGSRV